MDGYLLGCFKVGKVVFGRLDGRLFFFVLLWPRIGGKIASSYFV